jgi:hypothetical protein
MKALEVSLDALIGSAASTRRNLLKRLLGAGGALALSASRAAGRGIERPNHAAPRGQMPIGDAMIALSTRAHFSARPSVKEKLTWCFSTVLGCGPAMSLRAPGLAEPILAFRFPGGGSVSIEFTEDALDDMQARRGAWLELQTDDPDGLRTRVLEAGFPQVTYGPTTTFYFAAPGGQVFGIVDPTRLQGEVRKP